ncbi:MAG: hypothetical protein AMXMBFR56_08800 [Polyangiaceae bacterium]
MRGAGELSLSKREQNRKCVMRILDSLEDMVKNVHRLADRVSRHDRDLASQMKSASNSAALNGSEGVWAKAGKRRSRLEDALNSARETLMALRIARACGYLPASEANQGIQALDGIIAVLWVLAYRR